MAKLTLADSPQVLAASLREECKKVVRMRLEGWVFAASVLAGLEACEELHNPESMPGNYRAGKEAACQHLVRALARPFIERGELEA